MRVQSLGREDPLEEGMAPHSSIPAWRIPWTEEPGGLQSTGLHRVGHELIDLAQHSPAQLRDNLEKKFYNRIRKYTYRS